MSNKVTKGGISATDPIELPSSSDDDDECEVGTSVVKKIRKEPASSSSSSIPSFIPYNHPPQDAFPPSASFRTALSELVSSFEANESAALHRIHRVVCFSTPTAVCFYDKYRKARKHLLLIPRPGSPLGKVKSISDLTPSVHLESLKELDSLGRAIASAIGGGDDYDNTSSASGGYQILCGYHAVPSLVPLHLHIISSEFDSDCIKNKKHINSFTNPSFFVSPDGLEQHMESSTDSNMHVQVNTQLANSIIHKTPFSCFRCGAISGNVPQWKQHNRICNTKLPENYGMQAKNISLLGWERNTAGKKRKAEADESGKDIRKFFGSDKDGEGSIY